MHWKLSLCAVALTAIGCGGGTSTAPGDSSLATAAQEQVVVEMDLNGDEQPDIVTLDTTELPYKIVDVLQGTATGEPIDASDFHRGARLDGEISRAIADYLADSFGVQTRTEIDCDNESGEPVTVVVME